MRGSMTKVKGQAKRFMGKATGNRRLAARGRMEEVKGGMQQRVTRAHRRINEVVGRAERRVRAH
jgi:uncharacterized protein YjbJ (UPF0337 family)